MSHDLHLSLWKEMVYLKLNITKPLKEAMMKHAPENLDSKRLALSVLDTAIRCKVVTMRHEGKTDDEILEAIKPVFDRYRSLYINCI